MLRRRKNEVRTLCNREQLTAAKNCKYIVTRYDGADPNLELNAHAQLVL